MLRPKSNRRRARFSQRSRDSRRRVLAMECLETRRVLTTTYAVNTTDDVVDSNDGVLSLREAVNLANSNGNDAEFDVINLTPGANYRLTEGPLDILASVNFFGARDLQSGLLTAIDGNDSDRVFTIRDGRIDDSTGLRYRNNVNFTDLRITGGRADVGAAVWNAGTLTFVGSELIDNQATGDRDDVGPLGPAVFNLTNPDQAASAGLVQFIETTVQGNLLASGEVAKTFSEAAVQTTRDSGAGLVEGIGVFIDLVESRLDEVLAAPGSLPIIGDRLRESTDDVYQSLEQIRGEVLDILDEVVNLDEQALGGKSLLEVAQNLLFMAFSSADKHGQIESGIQAILAPYKSRLVGLDSALLNDGPDTGSVINPTDIVAIFGMDGRGKLWVEFKLHLGQRVLIDLDTFDVGLAAAVPFLPAEERAQLQAFLDSVGFDASIKGGLRLDIRWDIRMGVGASKVGGQQYFLNSGITSDLSGQSGGVEEFKLSIEAYSLPPNATDGFNEQFVDIVGTETDALQAEVSLGLLQATISDGTPQDVILTAPNALTIPLFLGTSDVSTRFTVLAKDSAGATITNQEIEFNIGAGENLPIWLPRLNLQILDEIAGGNPLDMPFSVTASFGRIDRFFNAPGTATTPSLVVVTRDPKIASLEMIGGQELGFLNHQVDDGRPRSLGFDNGGQSTRDDTSDRQVLTAGSVPPTGGQLTDDVDLILSLNGTGVVGDQKVRINLSELSNRRFIKDLGDLRARFESDAQDLVNNYTTYAGGRLSVNVVDASGTTYSDEQLEVDASGVHPAGPFFFQLVMADDSNASPQYQTAPTMTITYRAIDQTKLVLGASIDVVQSAFNETTLDDPRFANDQRFFDRVSKQDISTGDSNDLFVPSIAADMSIRLHTVTGAGGVTGFIEQGLGLSDGAIGLPELEFDFKFDAELDFKELFSNGSGSDSDFFTMGALIFDNVTLDVTKLVDSILTPLVDLTTELISPLTDIFGTSPNDPDALVNQALPVISDIIGDVSLRDVLPLPLQLSLDSIIAGVSELADIADELQELDFESILGNDSGRLVLGCLSVSTDPASPGFLKPLPCEVTDVIAEIQDFSLDSLLGVTTGLDISPAIFKVDLLKPSELINLLIGKPANVVSFGLPVVDFDGSGSFGFSFEELAFDVSATAAVDLNLRLGYDTTGLASIIAALRNDGTPDFSDLLDGLFIQNDPDGFEIGLALEFDGSGKIGPIETPAIDFGLFEVDEVVLFEAQGSVDIGGSLGLEIIDPNNDGKLRLDEIFDVTNDFADPEKLLCIFDIQGTGHVSASGSATIAGEDLGSAELGLVGGSFSLQQLLDDAFDISCPAPQPVLAEQIVTSAGTSLRINTGPFAADRVAGDADDSDATSGLKITVVEQPNGDVEVTVVDPVSSGALGQPSGLTQTFPQASFTNIVINGTDFDDQIDATRISTYEVTILAGAGDDDLKGGLLADLLIGGRGDDTVSGGAGNDQINGGVGNDLLSGDAGNDTISSGSGNDTLGGGSGDDQLSGEIGNDQIAGGGGDDVVDGGTGDDTISGGTGADTIRGGDGADTISAGDGNDAIFGDGGDDTIDGGTGADAISGGSGSDTLDGGGDDDQIDGGSGADIIWGGDGNDTLLGGSSNDQIDGGSGNDEIAGGTGNDILNGGSGVDTINGQNGADQIDGGLDSSADVLIGALGNDHVTLRQGDNVAQGDSGNDTALIDFSGSTAASDIVIDSASVSINGDVITTASFELFRVLLGSGSDRMDVIRSPAALVIDTGDGDDQVKLRSVIHSTTVQAGSAGLDSVGVQAASADVMVQSAGSEVDLTVSGSDRRLAGIQARIFADGSGGGTTHVTVDASGENTVLQSVRLDGLNVLGVGFGVGGSLDTREISSTTVRTGSSDDVAVIDLSDSTMGDILLHTGGGNDSVAVIGSGTHTGVVTVEGGQNDDELTVESTTTFVGGITLDGQAGRDTFHLVATPASPTTVRGGADNDTFNVTGFGGDVNLTGGSGDLDTLLMTVTDTPSSSTGPAVQTDAVELVNLDASSLTGEADWLFTSNQSSGELRVGTQASSRLLLATTGATRTTTELGSGEDSVVVAGIVNETVIDTGEADDSIAIGDGSLAAINADLLVLGADQASSVGDTLIIDATGQTATLTVGQVFPGRGFVSGLGAGADNNLEFATVESLDINTGDGLDTIVVEQTTVQTDINTSGGADDITIEAASDDVSVDLGTGDPSGAMSNTLTIRDSLGLASIGIIGGEDRDRVVVDRADDTAGIDGTFSTDVVPNFFVAFWALAGFGPAGIFAFTNVDAFDIQLGSGNDSLTYDNLAPLPLEVNVNPGAGDDSLTVTNLGGSSVNFNPDGQADTDRIEVVIPGPPVPDTFTNLFFDVAELIVNNSANPGSVDWTLTGGLLRIGDPPSADIIKTDGAAQVTVLGGTGTGDTITFDADVQGDVNAVIDGDTVRSEEGKRILTFDNTASLPGSSALAFDVPPTEAIAVVSSFEGTPSEGGEALHVYSLQLNGLAVYRKPTINGALELIQILPAFPENGDRRGDMVLSNDGKHLYAIKPDTGSGDGGLAVFSRDLTTGLIELVDFDANRPGDHLGTHPTNDNRIYRSIIAGSGSASAIHAFERDLDSGILTFTDDSGGSPAEQGPFTISPNGRFLYVAVGPNSPQQGIRAWGLKQNGDFSGETLTLTGTPDGEFRELNDFLGFDADIQNITDLEFHPDGNTLFVSTPRTITVIGIEDDGDFDRLVHHDVRPFIRGSSGAVFTDDLSFYGIGPINHIEVSADGNYLVTTSDPDVNRGQSAAIALWSTLTNLVGELVIDSYFHTGDNTPPNVVNSNSIAELNHPLVIEITPVNPLSGSNPANPFIYSASEESFFSLTIDDHGTVNETSDDTLAFDQEIIDGTTTAEVTGLGAVALSPDGQNLYAVGPDDNTVLVFDTQSTAINFNDFTVSPYDPINQDAGAFGTEDGGQSLRLIGNAYKAIDLDIMITPDSVLEFDFQSTSQGEIHAIGFDDNDLAFQAGDIAFQLYGTQNFSGTDDTFRDYEDTAPSVKHYRIPVGQFITGTFDRLSFIQDHDASPNDAESVFSNIVIQSRGLVQALAYPFVSFDGLVGVTSIAADNDGVYVTSAGDGGPNGPAVVVFDRNVDGSLDHVQTLSTALNDAAAVAIHPTLNTVYIAAGSSIKVHDRDAASGQLALAFNQTAQLDSVSSLAVSPDGTRLYSTDIGNNVFRGYTIDQTNGGIVQDDALFVGPAIAIAVSADSRFIYTANPVNNEVTVIERVDFSPGNNSHRAIQFLRDGVSGIRGLEGVSGLTLSPDGRFLYATGTEGNGLVVFERDQDTGMLLYVQSLRQNVGGNQGLAMPQGVVAHPDGRRTFVTSSINTVSGQGGLATFLTNDPVPEPQRLVGMFSGMEVLTVNTGAGSDNVAIVDAAAVNETFINTRAGEDLVNLTDLSATNTINTGANDDTIQLSSDTPGTILVANTATGKDTINVQRVGRATSTILDAGVDDDLFRIAGANVPANVVQLAIRGGDPANAPGDTLLFDPANILPLTPPVLPDGELGVTGFGVADLNSIETVRVIAPPIPDAGGPYEIDEGSGSITFNASATNELGNPTSYAWDINGDGLFGDVTGPTLNTNWNNLVALGIVDSGSYNIAVRATSEQLDGSFESADAYTTLTVHNVAPTIQSIVLDDPVSQGSPVMVTVDATDPAGSADPLTFAFDFDNDGVFEQTNSSGVAQHTYGVAGGFTVNVRVSDDDIAPLITAESEPNDVLPNGNSSDPQIDDLLLANNRSGSFVPIGGNDYQAVVTGSISSGNDGDWDFFRIQANAGDTLTIALDSDDSNGDGVDPLVRLIDSNGIEIDSDDDGGSGTNSFLFFDVTASDMYYIVADSFGSQSGDYFLTATLTTDSNPNVATGSVAVQVAAVLPAINGVTNSGPLIEGSQVTVAIDADPAAGAGGPFIYQFDFDGGGFEQTNNTGTAQHSYNDDGTYIVNVRVTDADGDFSESSTTVTVVNGAPTLASVTSDGPIDEGGIVTVTAVATDPGVNDTLAFDFDFDGDGIFELTNNTSGIATHTYPDNGVFPVNVRVADSGSLIDTASVDVTVRNVIPTAQISATDTSIDEGSFFTLDLTLLDGDPGDDTLTQWLVSWGDGQLDTYPVTTTQATHQYGDDGTYNVTASLSDEDGTYLVDAVVDLQIVPGGPLSVTVGNLDPTIVMPANSTIDEGRFTLPLSATDPGLDTILRWEVDWGDDTPVQTLSGSAIQASHFFDGGNPSTIYGITVRATDEDGSYVSSTSSLTVNNVAPTLNLLDRNDPVNEGGVVTISVFGSDVAGNADPLAYEFDFDNDGIYETRSRSGKGTNRFSDDGIFTVGVRVTDGDGGSSTLTLDDVTINNVAPSVRIVSPANVAEGSALTIGLLISEFGNDELVSYQVDWGDGSPLELVSFAPGIPILSATHIYEDGDVSPNGDATTVRTIRVFDLTDEDGVHATEDQFDVTIQNVSPTIGLSGDSSVLEGGLYTLSLGAVSDPGSDIVNSLTVFWGDGTSDVYTNVGDVTHTYAEGPYNHQIRVLITDEDGTSAGGQFNVTVDNVEPLLTSLVASPIAGGLVEISGTFADPALIDLLEPHRLVIDWGDAATTETVLLAPGARDFTVLHEYPANSSQAYDVRVTLSDDDPLGGLFAVDETTVYELDPDSGAVVRSFPIVSNLPDQPLVIGSPEGLAFDGQSVLVVGDDPAGTIYTFHSGSGQLLSKFAPPELRTYVETVDPITGEAIRTLQINPLSLESLGIDLTADVLYGFDSETQSIYGLDARTGAVRARLTAPTNLSIGPAGLDLNQTTSSQYVADGQGNILELTIDLSPTDPAITLLNTISPPDLADINFSGIGVVGDRLFVNALDGKIYELNTLTGATIQSFAAPTTTPLGLAGGPTVPPPNPGSSGSVRVVADTTATTPNLSVTSDVSAGEGQAVPFVITASLVDDDGSESLSIELSEIPDGATFANSAGDTLTVANGVLTLLPSQLVGLSITAADNGSFPLQVRAIATEISTGDIADRTELVMLRVDNLAPMTSLNAADHWIPTVPLELVVVATDASAVDELAGFTFQIDWGDGTASTFGPGEPAASSFQHAYAQLGDFTIVVTVTDKDGGQSLEGSHDVSIAGAVIDDGVLQIVGTDGRDTIAVRLHRYLNWPWNRQGDDGLFRDVIRVTTRLDQGGPGAIEEQREFEAVDVTRILIRTLGDDDQVTVYPSVRVDTEIHGGGGDDRLSGGSGDDVILGGPGSDELRGWLGDDVLSGGDGNDKLQGSLGQDVLMGGDGRDELRGGWGTDLLVPDIFTFQEMVAALIPIQNEWTRNDISFNEKIDHLRGISAGGLNEGFVFDPSTLFDDKADDAVTDSGAYVLNALSNAAFGNLAKSDTATLDVNQGESMSEIDERDDDELLSLLAADVAIYRD